MDAWSVAKALAGPMAGIKVNERVQQTGTAIYRQYIDTIIRRMAKMKLCFLL